VLDRDVYNTGFSLSVFRGIFTALLVAIVAWPVANFFDDSRLAVVMLALSVGTLISAFENIGIVDFRRDMSFRKEFDLQLWSRVAGAATTIIVAAASHSYWALVAGILMYRLVRLLQTYLLSLYRPRFSMRAWRKIIGFSLWTWGQAVLYQARERSDSIVIGRLLGAGQVGFFAVGLELGSLPTTELVEPLGRALFSGFASLHNAAQSPANMFLGAIGLGLMLVLPAGVGISMIADPMVRLCLGAQWLSAVPVVQIMAIGGITAILTQSCSGFLNAIGRPSRALYIGGVSALVRLIGLLVLVPYFGLPGAAVALLISNGADLVLLLWVTLPRIGISWRQIVRCIVRPSIATAAMGVVLWLTNLAWTPSHGESVLDVARDVGVRSTLGASCYVIVLSGAWVMAGRPDGAERVVVMTISQIFRRFGGIAWMRKASRDIKS
jgi:O-antigen/teichoic acid export membrane protein